MHLIANHFPIEGIIQCSKPELTFTVCLGPVYLEWLTSDYFNVKYKQIIIIMISG